MDNIIIKKKKPSFTNTLLRLLSLFVCVAYGMNDIANTSEIKSCVRFCAYVLAGNQLHVKFGAYGDIFTIGFLSTILVNSNS